MPFYLYGTAREMHIDHVLLRAPNAQLSAGEVVVELLPVEGDRLGSAFVAGLKGGLIAVADTILEFLMQPLSANSLKSFFHPGATRKLAVSIHHDRNAARFQGPGLRDQLGDPIIRGTITLADNTLTDAYMINVGTPTGTVIPQALKTNLTIAEATPSSQDHPLFRGYRPGGPRERPSSLERAKTWRNLWNEAGQSSKTELGTISPWSTPSDTEAGARAGDYYFPSLAQFGQCPSFHG
ncbi:hypothetical protein EDB92DRAFT_440300 [Lactarius akahatsu]|uniref:Uncharacterized protein n=1 Tax=Lactarius akahatsu TaxID=416441 RepID=A0AAD4LHN0_9AGAM|nr:hypothetical protein EDB92DRAFT_440300 [Lactarius akahatsu]